jgi:hypothetical protein
MTELWTIYHEAKPPVRPASGIVKQYVVGHNDKLPSRFASMNCYYDAWRSPIQPKIVGFQAYRKHFNFRDHHMTGWEEVPTKTFYEYQDWLYKWDGGAIEDFLDKYDMIVPPPFDLTAQGGLDEDFCRSRSYADWVAFVKVASKYHDFDYSINHVTSHWFICKWGLFSEFMAVWWNVFRELEPCIESKDAARNIPYASRALDFLTERFFTLWLASRSDLRTKTFPLMISWDAR